MNIRGNPKVGFMLVALALVVGWFSFTGSAPDESVREHSASDSGTATLKQVAPLSSQQASATVGSTSYGVAPGAMAASSVAESAQPRRSGAIDVAAAAKFSSAKDLQQYVDAALANPTPETMSYASWAIQECEFDWIPEMVRSEEVVTNPTRMAVLNRQEARCRMFDRSSIRKIREKVAADQDLRRQLLSADGSEYYMGLLGIDGIVKLASERGTTPSQMPIDSLLRSTDASVVFRAATDLAQASESLQMAGRDLSPAEQSSVGVALLLVGCDLGVPCDGTNPIMARACGRDGLCDYANLEDLFRSATPSQLIRFLCCAPMDSYSFSVAMQLRQQIYQALSRGDGSILRVKPN